MKIGKRLIYNKLNGEILNNYLGEINGDIIGDFRPPEIDFIDLEYGDMTLQDAIQYHVDIATKTIIVDSKVEHVQTETERIIELENQLLLSEGVI